MLASAAGRGLATGDAPARHPAARARLADRALLTDVARAGSRLVAVGAWGNVVLSDDAGHTWRQASEVPVRRTLTSVQFVDADRGWAVGHDAVVLHTDDGGEHWRIQLRAPEEDAPLLSVWFRDAARGLAVGAFGLLAETRDGGQSWAVRRLGEEGEEPHLNDVFAGPAGTLFIAAEFGRVLRSRDDGKSWELLRVPYEGSLWCGIAVEAPAGVLLMGMRGNAFRSSDLGESWQRVETGTDQSLQTVTRLRDGRLMAVGLGGTVLTSADEGRSFDVRTRPDRTDLAAGIDASDGGLVLVGQRGAIRRGARARASH
jgi:photosystem II stability/assembly factor-like uncharacterized protein